MLWGVKSQKVIINKACKLTKEKNKTEYKCISLLKKRIKVR